MALVAHKVFIITGSSSGIGLAAATLALDDGAKVLGVDIAPVPSSLEGRKEFHFLRINVAEPSAATAIVERCLELFGGRIDALLNVAGVMDNNSSADTLTDAMWTRCISINLTAPTKLIGAVLPTMVKQKAGSIVNVSSKAGMSGAVAGVAYTASVATGIVSSVDTGTFDMNAMATMKPIHEAHGDDLGNGAPIQPEEVAQMLLFLSSDRSSKISGAIIPIDVAWSTI